MGDHGKVLEEWVEAFAVGGERFDGFEGVAGEEHDDDEEADDDGHDGECDGGFGVVVFPGAEAANATAMRLSVQAQKRRLPSDRPRRRRLCMRGRGSVFTVLGDVVREWQVVVQERILQKAAPTAFEREEYRDCSAYSQARATNEAFIVGAEIGDGGEKDGDRGEHRAARQYSA